MFKCISPTKRMNFIYSHIYREGNVCANRLASFGTTTQGYVCWDLIPPFLTEDFFHSGLGLPNYRFR